MFGFSTRAVMSVVAVGLAVAVGTQGCAANELDIGAGPPLPDDGSAFAAEAGASTQAARCVATECGPGFATCPNPDGIGSTHTCDVDLSNDDRNCGRCGNACVVDDSQRSVLGNPPVPPLFGSSRCLDGACMLVCAENYADCNGIPEDGCETSTVTANDCGGCGKKCAPGVRCFGNTCGCPPGLTDCDGTCVDLQTDDSNCRSCLNFCDVDKVVAGALVGPDGKRLPPHMHTGCTAGSCQTPKCNTFNAKWDDCDGSLPADLALADPSTGNGCEVDLSGAIDNDHCGACDVKCAPGADCIRRDPNDPSVRTCGCPGQTMCASGVPDLFACVSTDTDTENCGFCGFACPNVGPHAKRSCERGGCSFECEPGWADCNLDPADGCEVNINTDPANCGKCGNACDLVLGQPCTNGVCAERDCPPGVTK